MMKKAVISLLFMTILAGCAAVPQEAVPTPSLTVDNAPEPPATSTPVPTEIKPTRTLIPFTTPTPTDILPLQKMLLTSYFDSPTPTFDATQAVTVTPATAAVCPEVNPDVQFEDGILTPDTSAEDKLAYILNFLNQGGSMEIVLEEINKGQGCSRMYYGDLNGDEESELMAVFYGEVIAATFELIGCTNGEYDNLHTVDLGGMTYFDD